MTVRHPYNRDRDADSDAASLSFDGEVSRTKQSFKKECDINGIMRKFQKTGVLTHTAKYAPTYGDATSTDLLEAMNTLTKAQEMFDDLPSSVRKKFRGPAEFLDFIGDEENSAEIYKLGLAVRRKPDEPLLVRVEQPAEPESPPA